MIKYRILKSCVIFFALLLFWGCASLPQPEEMKAQAANYQLPKLPDEGKALVYVVRPSTDYGFAILHVYIDNKEPASEVGNTKGSQYISFNITPGFHTILSKGENWSEIKVSAKAGDIIFIKQETAMPILHGARNKLLSLQDYEGKYYLKTLSLNTVNYGNQYYGSKELPAASAAPVIPKGGAAASRRSVCRSVRRSFRDTGNVFGESEYSWNHRGTHRRCAGSQGINSRAGKRLQQRAQTR